MFTRKNDGTICYVVAESYTYIDNRYEVAAWHDTLTIHAGEYPVTLTTINGTPIETTGDHVADCDVAYYATYTVNATRTESYTPSLWGGVQIGSYTPDRTVSEVTRTFTAYAFSLKHAFQREDRVERWCVQRNYTGTMPTSHSPFYTEAEARQSLERELNTEYGNRYNKTATLLRIFWDEAAGDWSHEIVEQVELPEDPYQIKRRAEQAARDKRASA